MATRRGDGPRPWKARWWDERGRERSRGFPTKKAAEAHEREMRTRVQQIKDGVLVDPGAIVYRDLVELFLGARPGRRGSRWLNEMLAYSLAAFGPVYVRTIQPHEVGRWVNGLTSARHPGRPLAAKTKQHILDVMRQVLNFAVENGYLARSPARPSAVASPKRYSEPTRVQPFASWSEVLAVAEQAGSHGPLIRFACATGLRPEEWIALRWSALDLVYRTLSVLRVVVDGVEYEAQGKVPGALRTVELAAPAVRALDELPRPLDRDAIVFPAAKGGVIHLDNWRQRVWKPAVAAAGLPHRPLYQMRHTYATLALDQGCSLEWIAEQLGDDIRTARKHYARFRVKRNVMERARLDKLEGGADERQADRK